MFKSFFSPSPPSVFSPFAYVKLIAVQWGRVSSPPSFSTLSRLPGFIHSYGCLEDIGSRKACLYLLTYLCIPMYVLVCPGPTYPPLYLPKVVSHDFAPGMAFVLL